MDDNKRLDEASMTHTHKVTMTQALAIDAMQDVLDLAKSTRTDEKYAIAISMSLDALKEVPQLRAQLAAVTAERDKAVECIRDIQEAAKFQRLSAVRVAIAKWRGPQGAGEGENEQAEV